MTACPEPGIKENEMSNEELWMIADKISKALGPDVMAALVNKSLLETVESNNIREIILKAVYPAIERHVTTVLQQPEVPEKIKTAIVDKIAGMIDSAVRDILARLVSAINQKPRG